MSTSSGSLARDPRFSPSRRTLAIVVVVLLAAGGFMALAIVRSNSDAGVSVPLLSGVRVGGPQILPVSQVISFAATDARPIYWAGAPGPGSDLEVTETTTGNVSVRYLFGNAVAGDPRRIFTTIATYGLAHAYRVVFADGAANGASRVAIPGGGVAVTTAKAPGTYYVAFRHENYLVEVYAKSPAHALRLVLSGAITPIDRKQR